MLTCLQLDGGDAALFLRRLFKGDIGHAMFGADTFRCLDFFLDLSLYERFVLVPAVEHEHPEQHDDEKSLQGDDGGEFAVHDGFRFQRDSPGTC